MKKRMAWRIQSDEDGFDEIVVRHTKDRAKGLMLHAEMLDDDTMYVNVAGLVLWVHVDRRGVARIVNREDRRDDDQMKGSAT